MIKTYITDFSQKLFQELKSDEQLGLNLHSEESLFLRFNHALVRQNTNVNQHELTMQFHKDEKIFKTKFNLTLNESQDLNKAREILNTTRQQLVELPQHPHFYRLKNHGHSTVSKKSIRPSDDQIPGIIHDNFKNSDLVGFWSSGPLRQISANSEGQFHFFENDFFFFDYSIYDGPKAAKGFYSTDHFSIDEFNQNAEQTKNKLRLLKKPLQKLERGQYDVFLEPMAVAEILGILHWGAFSQSEYNKGRAPLKKLKEKKSHFSRDFSIRENFELGLSPLFNTQGELSPLHLDLISFGELKNMLVSSETAQEYKLESNFADTFESPRSLELRHGNLNSDKILQKLGTGIYISNLHYINYSDIPTARITGMTRFACFFVKDGEFQGPIQDLRFDETLYNMFGENLVGLTLETQTFPDILTYDRRRLGGLKTPGALIKNFNFTL